MYTIKEVLYQVVKIILKFETLQIFCHFFSFYLRLINMEQYGNKSPNNIFSESTHQIHSPQVMHTPMEGLYQNCYFLHFLTLQSPRTRNLSPVLPSICDIDYFVFFIFFIHFFFGKKMGFPIFHAFFRCVHIGPYGSEIFKTLPLLHILQRKVIKCLLNFLHKGPHKTNLGFFKFWKTK